MLPEAPSFSPRTTNGAESFHRHLKDDFNAPKPNIHLAIETLRKVQSTTYLKLNNPGRKRSSITDEKVIFIAEKYMEMKNNRQEGALLEYFKKIKSRCQPPKKKSQ